MCKEAPIVPKIKQKLTPRIPGQTSLRSFARGEATPLESGEYEEITSHTKGTRLFPHFQPGKGNDLDAFQSWLTTAEGKLRTPEQATEIVVDVSKLMR